MTVSQAPLSADRLIIEPNTNPTKFASHDELRVNQNTDYILEADWTIEEGWAAPVIHAYRPLLMDPTASVLHYATTCFEGMKAYRSEDGKTVNLFRPRDNISRLNDSTQRACLPYLDPEATLALLEKYVELEARFIAPGGFIYLRPMVMGTDTGLGLKSPSAAKFMIMASMLPKLNTKPMKLFSSSPEYIRAWKGGFGYAKLGANYGPTLLANREAVANGYTQVLWLMGESGVVTEAGGANFFAAIKNEQGVTEILTCPLSTGVILPGVTRRSVIELLNEKYAPQGINVVEKEFTIGDIAKASAEGRLVEAFAVGTAYFVAAVGTIRTPEGTDIEVPLSLGGSGEFAAYAKDTLSSIMWGSKEHAWAHSVAHE